MMAFDKAQLLEKVTNHYLESHDYNGFPVKELKTRYGLSMADLRELLEDLIMDNKISLVFDTNPHIKRFPLLEKNKQIERLQTETVEEACLYPANDYLKQRVDCSRYAGRPYDLEMALGGSQCEFRAFNLAILESYRNDPRYYYQTNDIRGKIYSHDERSVMSEKDKIHLKTFGFCYDQKENRAVAVFLRYLKGLSPEHQQMWKHKELPGEWQLHPDYYKSDILGSWDLSMSIFDAFIGELKLLNQMSGLMGRPPLFKETFEQNRPKEFSFLLRPTQKEFDQFVEILDIMMSDNINKNFFKDEINGTFENGNSKGTITMLEEWLEKTMPKEWLEKNDEAREFPKELFSVFREIRRKRSKSSHKYIPDLFDPQFFHEQRELIIKAYNALSLLRRIFYRHPAVRQADIKIPECLQKPEIWTQ